MRRLARKIAWVWIPIFYAAVVLLLYRELWLGVDGVRRAFGWDCIEEYWPDLAFFARSLRMGEWPLWNPYDRGGYSFHGDPQVGLYYPLSWIFAFPGALAGAMPAWTIQAKALLHHILAGALMHAYLRSRALSTPSALFGGVAVIVSAPMIIHKASALIWPMIWTPLIWLAIDRAVERARRPGWWRRAAGLAAAVSVANLAGSPPGFWYVLLATGPYGAYRLALALRDARGEGRLAADARLQARTLGLAVAVTIALLAVALVPARAVVAESSRASRTLAYALEGALPVMPTLRAMVAPAAGKVDAYLGGAFLFLAACALCLRPRADRGAMLLCGVLAGLTLALSFGAGTPLLPFLAKHVPGFGLFRIANRYKNLAAILAVPLAAHGLEALLQARRRDLLLVGCVLAAFVLHAVDLGKGTGLSIGLLLGAGALAAGCVLLPARWRVVAAAGFAILAYADVAHFAHAFVRTTEAPPDDREDRRFLAGFADVERDWRTYDEFVMEQRPGSRLGIRDFRGYPSGDPLEDVRYKDVLARARRSPQILEAFNVRYVLHGPHHRNGKNANYLKSAPPPPHFRPIDRNRFEAQHAAPLVAWYAGAALVADRERALDLLETEAPVAVVERADAPGPLPEAPPRRVEGRLVAFEPHRIVIDVDAPAPGVVVLNEKMFDGWQVRVDGKPSRPFRANVLLRAVAVDAGPHRLEWTFEPRALWILQALFIAAVVFLSVTLLESARRDRHSGA